MTARKARKNCKDIHANFASGDDFFVKRIIGYISRIVYASNKAFWQIYFFQALVELFLIDETFSLLSHKALNRCGLGTVGITTAASLCSATGTRKRKRYYFACSRYIILYIL